MFSLTGFIDNKKLQITYRDGKISGDDEAIARTLKEANKDHGTLGLNPTTLDSNYLTMELPARILIEKYVFDKIISKTDDWEEPLEDMIF